MKQQLIELLRGLGGGSILPENKDSGLCAIVYKKFSPSSVGAELLIEVLFCEWDEYSGDETFPVPDPDVGYEEQRFPIGLVYINRHDQICTITDCYKTHDKEDVLVKLKYVAEHVFNGQTVRDYDVLDTTIARALAEEGRLEDVLGENYYFSFELNLNGTKLTRRYETCTLEYAQAKFNDYVEGQKNE